MKITTVLFDLDGTLLPMDTDEFTKYYFGLLCRKMVPRGYDPDLLVKGLWVGVKAMMKNDGSMSNEDAFWKAFTVVYGKDVTADIPVFDDFYRNEFEGAKVSTFPTEKAPEIVRFIKENGLRVALATNPIFPKTATLARIRWAGFVPEDFEKFTAYEEDCFCKPNPEYFRHFIKDLGVCPEECLMVGNDATEDLAAAQIGMKVFLIDDYILNRDNTDISNIPHGSFDDLKLYIQEHILN